MAWLIGGLELYEVVTNFNNQWYWLVLSTVYGIMIAELFGHMAVTHQMVNIDTRSWFYKLMVYLQTIFAQVSLRGIYMNHAAHHIHTDVKYLDPLDSRRMMHLTCSLSPLMHICRVKLDPMPDRDRYIKEQQKKFKDIINDQWTNFCDKHNVLLIIISWTLCYMVLPVIFFKILMLGRLTVSIAHTISSLGHFKLLFGYRHINSNDKTHNHLLLHYALGCLCSSVLQHNHHNMNIQQMKTHRHKWYEFDLGSVVVRYVFSPLMSKKN
jgi:hypothetical protein